MPPQAWQSGWYCPNCRAWQGAHRRKCNTYNCRTPNPSGGEGAEASQLLWQCSSCAYAKNFAGRTRCRSCNKDRETRQGSQSSGPRFPASNLPSTRAQRGGSQQRGGQNSFQSALQKEVARLTAQAGSEDIAEQADAEEEDASRAKVQIAKLDTIITKLKPLAELEDEGAMALLAKRMKERTDLRDKLRAMKPLTAQIRNATEARDKALKQHMALTVEVADLRKLLATKGGLVTEAVRTTEACQVHLDELTEKQRQEHARSLSVPQSWDKVKLPLEATPQGAEAATPRSPVQCMAWLAASLKGTPDVANSFQQWLGTVEQQQAGDLGVIKEARSEEEELEDMELDADEELVLGTPEAQEAASQTPVPQSPRGRQTAVQQSPEAFKAFRAQRKVRADPYQSADEGHTPGATTPSGTATPSPALVGQ